MLPWLNEQERVELDALLRTTDPEFRGAAAAIQDCTLPEWIIAGPSETGKTVACLYLVDRLCRQYPGVQGAMVRKVRADMPGTVLEIYRKLFLRDGVVSYGGEEPKFYLYPNGSRIWIGGMDRPGSVLSGARDFIYVNQAEELKLGDWEMMTTRTTGRAGNMPFSMLFGDANPGPPSHWILKRDGLKLFESRHQDNPRLYTRDGQLTPAGVQSMARLDKLTGMLYQRLRLGKWVQAEGVVYAEFDTGNLTDDGPDPNWPIELGTDDGYNDPRCILFIQKKPDRILVFDEIFESFKLAEHHVREAMARTVHWRGKEVPDDFGKWGLEQCWEWCRSGGQIEGAKEIELPEICVGPPEAKELQQRFRMAGIKYRFLAHHIVDGINAVRPLLCDTNGVRTVKVNKQRCPNLIKEITDGYRYPEGQRRDNENPVDAENHACDAFRYWVFLRARR